MRMKTLATAHFKQTHTEHGINTGGGDRIPCAPSRQGALLAPRVEEDGGDADLVGHEFHLRNVQRQLGRSLHIEHLH